MMLMVLYGLVATVALLFLLMAVLAWHMPDAGQPVAQASGEGPSNASAAAAKVASADAISGKEIFATNCASCHNTNADKLLGPGLAGIRQRSPGDAWLQKWIRNSSAVIASGDAYAVKIFNDNGKIQMTSFPSLTDLQIKQVLDYVDSEN
ncbi:MAG: cytochrome c [Cytophagaceae bacterium]|nr:MAG: cytochrome c [Cytophagaceae bacterium]